MLKNHHTIYTNKLINDKQWLAFAEKVELELSNFKDNFHLDSTDRQWTVFKKALRVSASKCLPKKKISTDQNKLGIFISSNDKNYQILSAYRKLFNKSRAFFLHQYQNTLVE
jgi:hypothetical protein